MRRGKKQNVDLAFIVSIIDAESYGRNIIGRRNRNGTRDYGIMQVNGVHEPKNPRKLLNISYNLQKGVGYIKYCTNKSVKRYGKAEIKTIARLYNQGANGSEKRYKNWKYVEKVYNNYKRVKEI